MSSDIIENSSISERKAVISLATYAGVKIMEATYSSLSTNGINCNSKGSPEHTSDSCSSSEDEALSDILDDENYWLKCALCGKKFATKKLLDIHMLEHGSKKNTCRVCGKFLTSKKNLRLHMSIHSGEKNFICEICGQRFRLKSFLNRHRQCHLPKAHNCGICGKTFSHYTRLALHQRSHTERKFQCDVCGKLFSQKPHLNTHMFIHNNKKNFQCEDCGKCFFTKGNLNVHSFVHTGLKKYECNECGKGFPVQSRLKLHMLVHTGEKSYQCEECGKQFKYKISLNNHTLHHHGINKKVQLDSGHDITITSDERLDEGRCFSCGECGRSFDSFRRLEGHMQLHEVTDESFRPHDSLSNDANFSLASKSFKQFDCYKCGGLFTSKSSLSTHLKSVHSDVKQFQCMACDKAFSRKSYLESHMVVHTGEKNYKCEECGKCFTQKSSLNTHLNLHKSTHRCNECGKIFGRSILLMRHLKQGHNEDRVDAEQVKTTGLCDENDRNSDFGQEIVETDERIVLEESDLFLPNEEEDLCILVEIDDIAHDQSNLIIQPHI